MKEKNVNTVNNKKMMFIIFIINYMKVYNAVYNRLQMLTFKFRSDNINLQTEHDYVNRHIIDKQELK